MDITLIVMWLGFALASYSVVGNDVIQTIEALNQHGMTIVMVTHDGELGQRAHRQISMVDGNIVDDRKGRQ